MALKMKNVIQAKAKENQRQSGGDQKSVSQKSDEPKIENMRTDDELSKLAGFNLGGLVNQIYSGICAFCAHSKGVSCCPVLGYHVFDLEWRHFDHIPNLYIGFLCVRHTGRAYLAAENSAVNLAAEISAVKF